MHVRLTREQKIKILNSHSVYDVMQQILLRENDIRGADVFFNLPKVIETPQVVEKIKENFTTTHRHRHPEATT